MSRKAKLITATITVRVVVDVDDNEDEIIRKSRIKFLDAVNNCLGDNIYEIEDDLEMPFDENYDI